MTLSVVSLLWLKLSIILPYKYVLLSCETPMNVPLCTLTPCFCLVPHLPANRATFRANLYFSSPSVNVPHCSCAASRHDTLRAASLPHAQEAQNTVEICQQSYRSMLVISKNHGLFVRDYYRRQTREH